MFGRILARNLFPPAIVENNAHFYALKNKPINIANRKTSHKGWFFLKKSDFEGKTFLLQELLSLHKKYRQFVLFCQSHLGPRIHEDNAGVGTKAFYEEN